MTNQEKVAALEVLLGLLEDTRLNPGAPSNGDLAIAQYAMRLECTKAVTRIALTL